MIALAIVAIGAVAAWALARPNSKAAQYDFGPLCGSCGHAEAFHDHGFSYRCYGGCGCEEWHVADGKE